MLQVFLASAEDGVFYIGHSSALVRISGKLFLLDPVWNHAPYGKHWKFVPDQIDCTELLYTVDGVILSHIHEDHFCDDLLSRIDAPFYVMAGRPSLSARLEKLRKNLFLIPPHSWVGAGKIRLYFIPHDFNTIDSSCLIASDQYCVYHGSDNFLSPVTAKKLGEGLRESGGTVDVAMVPYAFIHWYPFLMTNLTDEERKREVKRLNKQSLDQAIAFREEVKPVITVPFGASLFYNDGAKHPLNAMMATPYDFKGANPLFPGDMILKHSITHLPADETIYRRLIEESLGNQAPTKLDTDFPISGYSLEVLKKRVAKATIKVPGHMLIVNGISINLEDGEISTHRGKLDSQPYTRFDFAKDIFEEWIYGAITFEQAIGTRRFRCTRKPNIYKVPVFEYFNNFL